MIKINNTNKYFNKKKKNELHVLNNINLTLDNKGLVVISGPSGSGKTTLLNVIGGLDKADSGSVVFNDSQKIDEIRNNNFSFIFQNYHLFNDLTVYDNVAFTLRQLRISDEEAIKNNVFYILKALGIFKLRYKKCSSLSGGEQQRVSIARALIKNPKVIIADEPTGNLDYKNSLEIMNIIKQISLNTLVILVTHDKELANFYADRIIELKDGQIISDSINESKDHHALGSENIAYLKDFKINNEIANDNLKVNYYSDDKNDVTINLIVKNNTIYIDVASNLTNVKFADDNLVIKDEHFNPKSREEQLKTTFDQNLLDNSNLERKTRFFKLLKESLIGIITKITSFSRKAKLMMFVLALGGAIFAFVASGLLTVLLSKSDDFLVRDGSYYHLEESNMSYEEFEGLAGDDLYLSPYDALIFNIANYVTEGYVEYSEFLKEDELYAGRLPVNNYEIVLSYGIFDNGKIQNSNIRDIGIWRAADLIGEIVRFEGFGIYTVVGVSSASYKAVYFNSLDAYRCAIDRPGYMMRYELLDDKLIIEFNPYDYSEMPITKIILANEYQMFDQSDEISINQVGPSVYLIEILSTHELYIDYANNQSLVYVTLELDYPTSFINRQIYMGSYLSGIYFRTQSGLVNEEDLNDAGFIVRGVKDYASFAHGEYIKNYLSSSLIFELILILATAICFYFLMRSKMISQIYSISVKRALGVKKIEIIFSFLVEIIVLTTISSLIGYVITAVILRQLSVTALSIIFSVNITLLSSVVGVVVMYCLNIIVGLLPIVLLLRKTPASIIASYDL